MQNMIVNRKNKMAADILLNGQCEIAGYAADGKVVKTDTVRFDDWTQKLIPAIKWNQANADIYGDLAEMSASIQENAGMVPTIAICGKNIMDYILGNDAIMKYMNISNNANLSLMSFQPRITAPQVMFMGRIMSLNLELYSYMETYTDEEGHIKSFIGDDDVTQTSHTENIPYALINQLELNVESHSRTLLCTQTTHPKSGQIVQESFQERFDQQDF